MATHTKTAIEAASLVARARTSTIASLFAARVRAHPSRVAIEDAERSITYAELADRSARLASVLASRGVTRGTSIALLSENRREILEVFLAAARLGAFVACQSWRLAERELAHCLDLVSPSIVIASSRFATKLPASHARDPIVLGDDYEARLAHVGENDARAAIDPAVDPEDALLVLYTSGTTGLPKGAVLSHRAEVARNLVFRVDLGIAADRTFVAWPPLFHMGAAECSLGALISGGRVVVVDGLDLERLATIVGETRIGWLPLMPGTVAPFVAEMRRRGVVARGVDVCGAMADLVPPDEIAEVTALLGAPFANSFGATETGWPPCSADLVSVGVSPARLPKRQSACCEVRLVDKDDHDVPDETPGELVMRGPTLFSGYWAAPEATAHDFRGGWFHMGDVFVHHADGTFDYVDRVKYLIKSGGENVYPAEIERVLLADPRVAEAAVVRRKDTRWGEVPVAVIALRDGHATIDEASLRARCRSELAGYKQPNAIVVIALDDFPRSASGKVQRQELERAIAEGSLGGASAVDPDGGSG